MAVQNMYNNYLKRQQQTPTNQFRQKVANSLGGKSVGNNTTQKKLPAMMGNTSQNTLGNGVQNKSISRTVTQPTTTPITPQTPIQTPTTPSNTIPTQSQAITPSTQQTPLETTTEPLNAIPATQPTEQTPGVGMMSLEDINNYMGTDSSDEQDYEQSTNSPLIGRATTKKNKTPQQLAEDALKEQKKQAQKEWEQQQKALQLQKDQLEESNKQSIKDADNAYKETESDLQENRYTQQEDLAVSGQKRGIQYSPQQLALENVANINLNKNLADASKNRNELLNNLAIQLSQALANVDMGLQNATVEYNKNVAGFMTTYQQQIADWAYNDQQTQADRDFEKEMANSQNKWQANENALDRKQYSKSSSGGSGYSYGRSYTPYSSNYSPYSTSQSYADDLDLSTSEGSEAFLGTAKDASTALYNALDSGGLEQVNDKGKIYIEQMDQMIDYAKKNGADSKTIEELQKTRQVATKHLYNKTYARDTNSTIKIGDTYQTSSTPLKKKTIENNKKNALTNASKYNSIVARTNLERNASKNLAKTMSGVKKGTIKKTVSSSKKVGAKNDFVYKPKNTGFKQTASSKKLAKKVSTSKNNISTAKKKVQATTNKKASQNNKKRTQTKFQKSFSNLKKNIGKLFGW